MKICELCGKVISDFDYAFYDGACQSCVSDVECIREIELW